MKEERIEPVIKGLESEVVQRVVWELSKSSINSSTAITITKTTRQLT